MTPKAQAVRAQINKWDSIKLKSSAQQRKPSIDERQPTKQERRAANHTSDEELTSKTYKEFIQFNGKNTNNLILKWAGVPIVAQWIMNLTSIHEARKTKKAKKKKRNNGEPDNQIAGKQTEVKLLQFTAMPLDSQSAFLFPEGSVGRWITSGLSDAFPLGGCDSRVTTAQAEAVR